jgi:6-phosphogluconolactonase (cycloisomerase 2 family)
MKYANRIFSLLAIAGYLLIVAGCGQVSNCKGITFGGSGGSSGGAGGGLSGAGNACSAGSGGNGGAGGSGTASDLLYYLGGGTVIDVAGLTSTTFANVTGYTPAGFPNGTTLGLNFSIVKQKYLYVSATAPTGGGEIIGYAITRGSAALTPLGSSPFATSTPHADVAVSDPQGRFLFVSDIAAANITVFKIDATTGSLTATGTPITGAGPDQMVVDGSGNYLYFPAGSFVFGYSIDQTSGALTPLLGSPFSVLASALQADPTGKFLLSVSAADNNVSVIPIGAGTGILGVPTTFPAVQIPSSLALSPNGKFLFTFAVDRAGNPLPIEGFTFDVTTGTLTAMANSPFTNLPKVAIAIFDQNGTTMIGVTVTSFIPYFINATTGAPTSPVPALSVAHDERYAVTN